MYFYLCGKMKLSILTIQEKESDRFEYFVHFEHLDHFDQGSIFIILSILIECWNCVCGIIELEVEHFDHLCAEWNRGIILITL